MITAAQKILLWWLVAELQHSTVAKLFRRRRHKTSTAEFNFKVVKLFAHPVHSTLYYYIDSTGSQPMVNEVPVPYRVQLDIVRHSLL